MTEVKSRPHSKAEAAPEEFGGSGTNDTDSGSQRKSTTPAASNPPQQPASRTQNDIIQQVTLDYIAGLDVDNPPEPRQIERDLIAATNFAFGLENASRKGDNKISLLKTLTFFQVAQLMLALHRVVRIEAGGVRSSRAALLGIYASQGRDEGIYVCDEDELRKACRVYNNELTLAQAKEVFTIFRESAPWVSECEDKDLIAVNNGLFNYATKELLPFDPNIVLRSKSQVDFDPAASSPQITMPDGEIWDVESWMESLSDDPSLVELLWQVTGAIIRPNVRWNKSAWFFSKKGNNGKGTLVELMRGLCGDGRHVSIPLDEMGKDFMLEQALNASAIIVDENNVGIYIDRAANLKALITNDTLMVNRKGLAAITYRFRGFMVQCLNEYPRTRDKSDSFYRRQLFIPFEKNFSLPDLQGRPQERTYIKDDYVRRPDVLRYVLKKVLMDLPTYYSLNEPEAATQALDEFKTANNAVREWWLECQDRFAWDLLTLQFLHDHHQGWRKRNIPGSTSVISKTSLGEEVLRVVAEFGGWKHPDAEKTRVGTRMDRPEPMVVEYRLEDWVERDKYDRPNWTVRKPPPLNARWCLIRDGVSSVDQALLLELSEAQAAHDAAHAQWAADFAARGLDPEDAKFHADLQFYKGGCGIKQCPVCGRRRTPEQRVRAAESERLSLRLARAIDAVMARGLDPKSVTSEPGG